MIRKIIFLLLLFYILVLFQTSFLVHFHILGIVPNLVLIAVVLINLFISLQHWFGITAALIGGFYLDIFSTGIINFFGFYTLILLSLALFIRFILIKYVQIPELK